MHKKTLSIPKKRQVVSFTQTRQENGSELQNYTDSLIQLLQHRSGGHSQIWAIPTEELGPFLAAFRKSFEAATLPIFRPERPGLAINRHGQLIPYSASDEKALHAHNKLKRRLSLGIAALGTALFGGYHLLNLFSLLSNTSEKGSDIIDTLARTLADPLSIQDTTIFQGFVDDFAEAIPIAGFLIAWGISKIPVSKLLSGTAGKMIDITTDCTSEDLLGTPDSPGYLLQTQNRGVLFVGNWQHFDLDPRARSVIETTVSNCVIDFQAQIGTEKTEVPYDGQIIVGYESPDDFSKLASQSGRVKFMSLSSVAPPPLPPVSKDKSDIKFYKSSALPNKDDPFATLIGRGAEIARLKKIADKWLNQWAHYSRTKKLSDFPKTLSIVISDKNGNQFGNGKTTLANELEKYIKLRAFELDIQFHGIELCREDNLVTSRVLPPPDHEISPGSCTRVKNKLATYTPSLYKATHLASVVPLTAFALIVATLKQVESYETHSNDSALRLRLFLGMCLLLSLSLMIGNFFGVRMINKRITSEEPRVLFPPTRQPRSTFLAAPPLSSDFAGKVTPNRVPQDQRKKSDSGSLIFGKHIVKIECGAIDPDKSDTQKTRDQKRSLASTVASTTLSNTIPIAHNPTKAGMLFILTTNRPEADLEPALVAQSTLIPLESITPYNPSSDKAKLVDLIKSANRSLGGPPWTTDAIIAFITKIQFTDEPSMPPGSILIQRSHFEDLIPEAIHLALRFPHLSRNSTCVTSDIFELAWERYMKNYYATVFQPIFQSLESPAKTSTRDRHPSPPPLIDKGDTVQILSQTPRRLDYRPPQSPGAFTRPTSQGKSGNRRVHPMAAVVQPQPRVATKASHNGPVLDSHTYELSDQKDSDSLSDA